MSTMKPSEVLTGAENVGDVPVSRADPVTGVEVVVYPDRTAVTVTVDEAPGASPVTVTDDPSTVATALLVADAE